MTTIVYDHKTNQIACDSRATCSGYITSDSACKYRYNEHVLWFFAGDLCDIEFMMSDFQHRKSAPECMSLQAIFVEEGIPYSAFISDGLYKKEKMWTSDTFGSGGWHAQAALDFNKSVKEAVEYAMTRDTCTGGKVHVYDIEKGEFI